MSAAGHATANRAARSCSGGTDGEDTMPLDALEALLSNAVRLVAFPRVSNLLGGASDVAAAAALARTHGARVVVDSVVFTPHHRLKTAEWATTGSSPRLSALATRSTGPTRPCSTAPTRPGPACALPARSVVRLGAEKVRGGLRLRGYKCACSVARLDVLDEAAGRGRALSCERWTTRSRSHFARDGGGRLSTCVLFAVSCLQAARGR